MKILKKMNLLILSDTVIGSPRDVYDYDIMNRDITNTTDFDNNEEKEENNLDKQSEITYNNSDVIEGNMNLFDLIDKKNHEQ